MSWPSSFSTSLSSSSSPTLLAPWPAGWDSRAWWGRSWRGSCSADLLGRTVSASLFPRQARSVLGILGQIGLMLFLFLVGLELDWDLIKGKGKAIAPVGVGVVVVAMTLGLLIGPLLYDQRYVAAFGTPAQAPRASFALMVGAMLSSTAFPVTARTLQERKLLRTPIGSIGVAAAAAAAFTSVMHQDGTDAGIGARRHPRSRAWRLNPVDILRGRA